MAVNFWRQLGGQPPPKLSLLTSSTTTSSVSKLTFRLDIKALPLSIIVEDPRISTIIFTLATMMLIFCCLTFYLVFGRRRLRRQTVSHLQAVNTDEDDLPLSHFVGQHLPA